MGLRISTNIASEMVQKNLKDVSKDETKSLERLSSGSRINSASDDAAGLAIATKLKAETTSMRQATRNANDGISFVQSAEGGLGEVSNILIRLRELGIQSASDTVGAEEREFMDLEYQQLTAEVDRIASSTKFNGKDLLNGEGDGVLDFHIGTNANEENTIQFDTSTTNATSSNLGISGTGVMEKGDALSSLSSIDEAINQVSGQRANLGAIQGRLQTSVNNLENQTVNLEQARSVIQDADVASESSKLASASIVKSAGISTLSQANGLSRSALKLV
ncbi:MAG: flagellin [Bacteriovoracaceae bacterium]|jgi:flagellin